MINNRELRAVTCSTGDQSQTSGLVELDVSDGTVRHLAGQQGGEEVVLQVPGLHHSVLPAREDQARSAGAPAPGRHLERGVAGHDAAGLHVLRADPRVRAVYYSINCGGGHCNAF